jgi:hypothetical protein
VVRYFRNAKDTDVKKPTVIYVPGEDCRDPTGFDPNLFFFHTSAKAKVDSKSTETRSKVQTLVSPEQLANC